MKRTSISVSETAIAKLRAMQEEMEVKLGFEPSLSQIVEYLILMDKVTNGQDVASNQQTGESK
jgi:hypothetical protein